MNAKTCIAVAVAAALFSGAALAASGNPDNPDASTKNWQLNELRQNMDNKFNDLSNRVDQIQTGSGFDASGIYDRLDGHDQQIGDLSGRLDGLQVDINGVGQQVSGIGRDVDELKDRVDNKVDKDEFLKDQQKQNDRMDTVSKQIEHAYDAAHRAREEAFRANTDNQIQNEQIADLQANKVDRGELEDVAIKADGALAGAIENRNQIDQLRGDLVDTDKQVTTNKKDIADLKNQNGALNNAVTDAQNTANAARDKADKAQNTADKAVAGVNSVKNDVKVVSRDVANNSIRIQRNEERIDGAYAGIYDNRKNIEANRKAINRNSQEIQKLNKNFNDLKNTVDANRKRAAAGIAGVAAMANIPEVNSHQTFSLGVGVGGFDGQQAVAVGASARVNDNLTVKASVAANNEEVVWGAGAAIGW